MDIELTMSGSVKELTQILLILNAGGVEANSATAVADAVTDFKGIAPEKAQLKKTARSKAVEPEKVPVPVPEPKPRPEPPAEVETEAKTDSAPAERITLEMIREVAQAKSKGGHHSAIIALLRELKVKTIPEISKGDYPAFYEKLSAL